MVNQTDAAGNTLNYQEIGKWADGTPRYEAVQSLGAAGQALQAANQQTSQNLANLATEQSARLSGLLNEPLDFTAQREYLEGLTSGALDKTWNKQAQDFETSLINRGIRPGSTAYNDAMNQFAINRSDAYNSANVNNYNTALQSQMALRNQPLNEILALSGGSQLQAPSFGATPGANMAGTDVGGITNQGYASAMSQFNTNQGILGGLFSAGASLVPLIPGLSDRRAKTDIRRIGTADNGLPIYAYRYVFGGGTQLGFMADEVEKVHPEAVTMGPDGLKRVQYELAVI